MRPQAPQSLEAGSMVLVDAVLVLPQMAELESSTMQWLCCRSSRILRSLEGKLEEHAPSHRKVEIK